MDAAALSTAPVRARIRRRLRIPLLPRPVRMVACPAATGRGPRPPEALTPRLTPLNFNEIYFASTEGKLTSS